MRHTQRSCCIAATTERQDAAPPCNLFLYTEMTSICCPSALDIGLVHAWTRKTSCDGFPFQLSFEAAWELCASFNLVSEIRLMQGHYNFLEAGACLWLAQVQDAKVGR